MRRIFVVSFCSLLLGLIIGVAVGARAQIRPNFPSHPEIIVPPPPETKELGVRILRRHGQRVVGKLMARIHGQWQEVELAPQDSLATE